MLLYPLSLHDALPILSVSVGVPPETVTASLRLTVSVTTWPAFKSPVPAVIPVPVATTDETVDAGVAHGRMPATSAAPPPRLAGLTTPSRILAPLRAEP